MTKKVGLLLKHRLLSIGTKDACDYEVYVQIARCCHTNVKSCHTLEAAFPFDFACVEACRTSNSEPEHGLHEPINNCQRNFEVCVDRTSRSNSFHSEYCLVHRRVPQARRKWSRLYGIRPLGIYH